MARDGGPHPNIDFALGVLAEATRMVHGAGETVFAVARERGLDRARARGVPAPAALPHPRHLHRPRRRGCVADGMTSGRNLA